MSADWLSRQSEQHGVATALTGLFTNDQETGTSCCRPFISKINVQFPRFLTRSEMEGALACDPVASQSTVHISSSSAHSAGAEKDQGHPGRGDSGGSALAQEAMVSRSCEFGRGYQITTTPQSASAATGSADPPLPRAVPTDCMEVERKALSKCTYSDKVLHTLTRSSKHPFIKKVYGATWKRFKNGVQ